MVNRFRDDRNRDLVLLRPPRRIVSLVPSDTLSLFDMGVGDRVVGRTRYCTEPAGAVEHIPVCGGTKDIDVEAVIELGPELIIANQEENGRKPLEALAQRGMPVFVVFPRRVGDGFRHLARLARMLGIADVPRVKELIRRAYLLLELQFEAPSPPPRVFVPIWMKPLMTMRNDTFGNDMLELAGAVNVFADRVRRYPLAADLGDREEDGEAARERDTRYPRITIDEVIERAPDIVLLPDEPHCFSEEDAEQFLELDIPAARRGAIRCCDGKDLFWYGTRTIEALPRLRQLIRELSDR